MRYTCKLERQEAEEEKTETLFKALIQEQEDTTVQLGVLHDVLNKKVIRMPR